MKQVLAVALAALAAVALYAATAPAGQQAVTPKQFAALTKRVAKLEKNHKDLESAVFTCVFDRGAVAVTKSPAFHVTGTGETTDFYVLTTSRKECVDFINSPLVQRQLRR